MLIQFSIIPITKVAINHSKKIWLPLYIAHLIILIGFPIKIVTTEHIGFASTYILMCEGTRMLMKSHSYFRTKLLYLTDNDYK